MSQDDKSVEELLWKIACTERIEGSTMGGDPVVGIATAKLIYERIKQHVAPSAERAPFTPCVKCFTLESCREGMPCAFGRQDNAPTSSVSPRNSLVQQLGVIRDLFLQHWSSNVNWRHGNEHTYIGQADIIVESLINAERSATLPSNPSLDWLRSVAEHCPDMDGTEDMVGVVRAVHRAMLVALARYGARSDRGDDHG